MNGNKLERKRRKEWSSEEGKGIGSSVKGRQNPRQVAIAALRQSFGAHETPSDKLQGVSKNKPVLRGNHRIPSELIWEKTLALSQGYGDPKFSSRPGRSLPRHGSSQVWTKNCKLDDYK